ncbi:MAG TPA: hypothetical protein VLF18_19660 [Tahibacter sp.]|uniref:hypothetical protein n=1 Tax=Tahibacter sp. TaxID=2056211 RepID=UPI002B5C52D1|nr:hypothetical protein [Tahibacter sp.]HSX62407.1 hypothetical protein [Tahibacter sp.]
MTNRITTHRRRIACRVGALVALGLGASTCGAVRLDPNGLGQVLIYPYYTVRGGNQTIYTVTNHTDRHKVLQVQMSEGRNGRNVIAFNVFLAPYDSWSATAFSFSESDEASLLPGDSSCTYPRFEAFTLPDGRGYQNLAPFGFTGTRRDAGPGTYDRTREGYIKIFELATVVPETPPAIAMTPAATGVPAGCASLVEAYDAGYWAQDRKAHLTNPTGGLSGEAMVLNVAAGTVMAYQATALADFRTDPSDVPQGGRATVVNHFKPAEEGIGLDDALSDPATVFVSATIDLPNRRQELVYPRERAIDAVSAVLSADAVNVNYVNDASVGATTDWVVTFPTRPFYTDQAIVGPAAIKPFTSIYPGAGGSEASAAMPVPYSLRDRDGRRVQVTGGTNEVIDLRFNTQVVAIAPSVNIIPLAGRPLGSSLAARIGPVSGTARRDGGWMTLDFLRYQESGATANRSLRPAEDGTVMLGLPAIGFAAVNYVNAAAGPGVLANYSMANPQRRTQDCRRNTVSCK